MTEGSSEKELKYLSDYGAGHPSNKAKLAAGENAIGATGVKIEYRTIAELQDGTIIKERIIEKPLDSTGNES